MGFNSSESALFFKMKDGKVVISIKKEYVEQSSEIAKHASFSEIRISKTGIEYLDLFFKSFTGILKSVEKSKTLYNNQDILSWKMTFEFEGGQKAIWSVNYDSMMAQSFINSMASVGDFSKEMTLSPYFNKEGKGRLGVFMEGFGDRKTVPWGIPKEQLPQIVPLTKPDGSPVLTQNGKQMYDSSDRMAFLEDIVGVLNGRMQNGPSNQDNSESHPMDRPNSQPGTAQPGGQPGAQPHNSAAPPPSEEAYNQQVAQQAPPAQQVAPGQYQQGGNGFRGQAPQQQYAQGQQQTAAAPAYKNASTNDIKY
jgi:hypothetical protein